MASLIRTVGRRCLFAQQYCFMQKRVAQASSNSATAYEEMRKYWDKNRKLQRPLSPHLTIYKPHLAMVSSITFRITGVAMQVAVAGVSIALLALPGDYTHYLNLVKDMSLGPAAIYSFKVLLTFPLVYHFANGLRHLAWDAGMGFTIKTMYKSGYTVWLLTALFTAYFAFLY